MNADISKIMKVYNLVRALYLERSERLHEFYNCKPEHDAYLRRVKKATKQCDPKSDDPYMIYAVMYADSIMTRENVHYPMKGEK
jgi:hypothetical protein